MGAELSIHQKLLDASPDLAFVVDADGRIRFASQAMQRQLGWSHDLLIGQEIHRIVPPAELDLFHALVQMTGSGAEDSVAVEMQLLRSDGSRLWTEGVMTNLTKDGDVGGVVLNVRDIHARRELEQQLLTKSFYDDATGVATRALFVDRLGQALQLSTHELIVKLLFIDIDDFDELQNEIGWHQTDDLLQQIADRLRKVMPSDAIVGRYNAQSFLVATAGTESNRGHLISVIRSIFSKPFPVGSRSFNVSASIGLASATRAQTTAIDLIARARTAAQEARRVGRGQAVAYTAQLDARSVFREATKADLQQAIENDELILHYQPIIAVDTGSVAGVEALVRWEHPVRGLIPPSEFITIADETGMIDLIGEQVLERSLIALRQLNAQRAAANATPLTMTVNISQRQLASVEFLSRLRAQLSKSGVAPQRLIFDLNEATLGQGNSLIGSRLRQIRDLGIGIALDDFGTGYSSLSALRGAPVTHVKIDRTFVSNLTRDASELVSGIVVLAHALGLSTIAEGVETAEQFEVLRSLGCSASQGWFHARPMTFDDLSVALSHLSPARA